jgi:hypothetical protein
MDSIACAATIATDKDLLFLQPTRMHVTCKLGDARPLSTRKGRLQAFSVAFKKICIG